MSIKLEPCRIIEHGKCEKPENTVRRLEAALGALFNYRYIQDQTAEFLYWGGFFIDDINFEGNGKGISPTLCKASALAESAERLAIRDYTRLPGYVKAHQKDIDDPLKIEDLLSHVSSLTPELLAQIKDSDLAQQWVDAYSLMTGQKMKVPITYIHGISGTNGLASGNRIEEAIVQATSEIFERRTAITVLRNRLVMPTIDITTVENPIIRRQYDFVQSLNIEIYLKDFSFGGVLPCIGVYYINHNVPQDLQIHHILKVGTAFDREDAIMRAFTEFAQGRKLAEKNRPLRESYERLKCLENNADNFRSLFKFGYVSLANADFLKEGDLIPFDKGHTACDCLEDIERSKAIFRQLGKDYIVADFTDPRVGFPVIQAISPGYSDILPYHPGNSQVLLKGWTRNAFLGHYDEIKE